MSTTSKTEIFDYISNIFNREFFSTNINNIDLPKNTCFIDVNNEYLTKYIKDTTVIYAIMFNYYTEYSKWDKNFIKTAIDYITTTENPDLFELDDDTCILSETDDEYWFFWGHKSGNCDIGRFDKSENITVENLIKAIHTFIFQLNEETGVKYEVLPKIKGIPTFN